MAVPVMRLYMHAPEIVFAARVNMTSVTYPVQDITYDGVTTGAYTDCTPDMFFTLGSAAGLDDYGRGRLRAMPTSSILKVGRASQGTNDGELDVVDDAYITVYDDFRVFAKIPYIASDGTMYKDADMPVLDRTEQPPPVANTGPGFAKTIDPVTGTIVAFFPGSDSIAIADGATIVSWAWDIKDGTYEFDTTATDADIFASFPPGFRWVALTVTDSNGKTHSARCPVFARDPDDDACVQSWQPVKYSRSQAGVRFDFRIVEDLPRSTYPDGALVMCWKEGNFEPQSRLQMIFTGWHQSDKVTARSTETALLRDTTLECVDVMGRLDALPSFSQSIEVPLEGETVTWYHMPAATVDKYIHYLLQWHSTALDLADYFPSGTGSDYPFVIFQSNEGQNLYQQVNWRARSIVPDHVFTCNRLGQLQVIVDPMLQDVADRTTTIQGSFLEQHWSDLEFTYTRPPRVSRLLGSALVTQSAWILVDDVKTLEDPVFSVAPGSAPSQGTREVTQGEQLAQSQAALNAVTGHRYARLNARHGPIRLSPASGDDQNIEPADMTWVYLYFSDDTAPQRGLSFDSSLPTGALRALPLEVDITWRFSETGATQDTTITLELETVGRPALADTREAALPVGEEPTAPVVYVPDYGLVPDQTLVAAITPTYLLRTSDFHTPAGSGGPTWEQALRFDEII
ncbi:MAG: hypothetical protein IT328_04660, partial [Caldilineaceae bacterium]|nr:hypothetical protein [Caldilineaceae bacterium]